MSTRLPAFDVLLDMARNDPEGLETLRTSMTNAVIAGSTSEANQRRLKGLQFQVDMERTKAKTPLAATIRLSELMCQSLAELHRSMVESTEIASRASALLGPQDLTNPADAMDVIPEISQSTPKGARILPFRPL